MIGKILSDQLKDLHRRSIVLDVAVVLGAIGGAATCAAVLVLFLGALREATIANVRFGLFSLAVVCAIAAFLACAALLVRSILCRRRRRKSPLRLGCGIPVLRRPPKSVAKLERGRPHTSNLRGPKLE
jgi:predicted membrane protein